MSIFIGVGGGTGAGKTSVVRTLVERLGGSAIDLDSYYVDRGDLSPQERMVVNYDEPAAIDSTLLVEHLRRLGHGESIERPVYSFETHRRVGTAPMAPAPLILVEGLFTLWWPELRALFDLKVFVDAPSDVRLIRRLRRDVVERGRTVEAVLQQYLLTVRPMHHRYIAPAREHADMIVVNDSTLESCVEPMVLAIWNLLVAQQDRTRNVRGVADDVTTLPREPT